MSQLNALVIYWSGTGNTKKVAEAITRGLESQDVNVTIGTIAEHDDTDLTKYDLVCMGCPAYHFSVPADVRKFTAKQMSVHNKTGIVVGQAPQRPGAYGCAFVTYGGPHTGIGEALPAGEHIAQMLQHMGFEVRCKWYTVGEFVAPNMQRFNTTGFLGDIRNRPDENDLAVAERDAAGLAFILQKNKAAQES